AVGEGKPRALALDHVHEVDAQRVVSIGARRAPAPARPAAEAGEQVGEDLLRAAAEVELEAAGAGAAARIEATPRVEAAGELGMARIAVGIDLAAVEARPLLLVADDAVGGVHLLEALSGALVARLGVRVVLLGETAIRLFDGRGIGIPRHAEHAIGIAHRSL